MSDSEYSDSSSDSSSEDEFPIENKLVKPFKISKNITLDDDLEEIDDIDNDIEYDIQKGGEDDEDDSDDDLDELDESAPKKQIELSANDNYYETDEDDDDDETDENYLQKFDTEIKKNYINEFHPECLSHNYDEISKLTTVIRNSDNIVVDPFHKTVPYLTKFEKARILGQRSTQIENGAKPFINIPENIIDSYVIAELELREKKIPVIIERPIPGGAFEYWKLADLEILI